MGLVFYLCVLYLVSHLSSQNLLPTKFDHFCCVLMMCEVSLLSDTPRGFPRSILFPTRYQAIVAACVSHEYGILGSRGPYLNVMILLRFKQICAHPTAHSNSMQLNQPLMSSTSTVLHRYMYVTHGNTKHTICFFISIFCSL